MLSIISFFVVFTLLIHMIKFDPIKSLNQILLDYKYIGLKYIVFAINMNTTTFIKCYYREMKNIKKKNDGEFLKLQQLHKP